MHFERILQLAETNVELYGVVGAGGFGREILPIARRQLAQTLGENAFEIVFVDENTSLPGEINGHRVMSVDEYLSAKSEVKKFSIAIASHDVRQRFAAQLESGGAKPFSVIAPDSICLENNSMGEGAIICPYVTITSNTTIGKHFHGNVYSYIAHDSIIGDYVTFAPRVTCNGGVIIEDYAYIGANAVFKQSTPDKKMIIGEGAVVGMGSVVTRSVPPNTIVAGNPAVKIGEVKK